MQKKIQCIQNKSKNNKKQNTKQNEQNIDKFSKLKSILQNNKNNKNYQGTLCQVKNNKKIAETHLKHKRKAKS